MTEQDEVAKRLFRWLVVAAVVALVLLVLAMRWSLNRHEPQVNPAAPKELTSTVDHETAEMRYGLVEHHEYPWYTVANIRLSSHAGVTP